tara:strand:- start:406 stop:756 length:351 start_codon:yes stop_codon:yes gene_type:complete
MKKIIMFDIDDTICRTFKAKYSEAIPIKKRIKIINKLYDEGYYIKIFTARYMGRNNENSLLVKKKYYKKTYKQLVSWGLKFNELIMGKPTYDIYIDDKSYNSKEKKTFNKIYKLIS